MKERYKFKVGDKGMTATGNAYEVILIEPRAERPLVVLLSSPRSNYGAANVFSYTLDGRSFSGAEDAILLPPKQVVYMNIIKGQAARSAGWLYHSKSEAVYAARRSVYVYSHVGVPFEVPHE